MKEKFMEKFKKDSFRVTIFGSARIKRGTLIYNQVKTLARLLGERGIDVVTGGGPGLMEAANKGHEMGSEKTGARSIGIGIKLPNEQRFNKHLDIKKEFKRFSQRLDAFMDLSNVVVVAPGGVGTLLELFYTWQLVQVKRIHNIPIIMLGKQWPALIKWFEKYPLKSKFFEKRDINLLFLAKDCNETIKIIDKAHEEHQKGEKDFCINYKKYRLK